MTRSVSHVPRAPGPRDWASSPIKRNLSMCSAALSTWTLTLCTVLLAVLVYVCCSAPSCSSDSHPAASYNSGGVRSCYNSSSHFFDRSFRNGAHWVKGSLGFVSTIVLSYNLSSASHTHLAASSDVRDRRKPLALTRYGDTRCFAHARAQ